MSNAASSWAVRAADDTAHWLADYERLTQESSFALRHISVVLRVLADCLTARSARRLADALPPLLRLAVFGTHRGRALRPFVLPQDLVASLFFAFRTETPDEILEVVRSVLAVAKRHLGAELYAELDGQCQLRTSYSTGAGAR